MLEEVVNEKCGIKELEFEVLEVEVDLNLDVYLLIEYIVNE